MNCIAAVVVASKKYNANLENEINYMYRNNTIPAQAFFISNSQISGGICAKYNFAIEEILKSDQRNLQWIIFQHDDVKLFSGFENVNRILAKTYHDKEYNGKAPGILGVAGALNPVPPSPGYWWWNIRTPEFRGAGTVQHPADPAKKKILTSFYGPVPAQVKAIDGCWFAINIDYLRQYPSFRFDNETFKDLYHFYDADICATANLLDIPIEVNNIIVYHDSIGASMISPEFLKAQKLFIKKWWKKNKKEDK